MQNIRESEPRASIFGSRSITKTPAKDVGKNFIGRVPVDANSAVRARARRLVAFVERTQPRRVGAAHRPQAQAALPVCWAERQAAQDRDVQINRLTHPL